MNVHEIQTTLKFVINLKEEMLHFGKPLSNHLPNQFSDMIDKIYDSIRHVYIDENETLLKLRTTAKNALDKIVILNKKTVNSHVAKYKPVLLSVLNDYIMGVQDIVPDQSPA